MVMRQSLRYGRTAALWSTFGVGLGNIVHMGYALLGVSVVIAQSPLLFSVLKYIGAAYLITIGFLSLWSSATHGTLPSVEEAQAPYPARRAVWVGFLTNVLNPKAALFLMAMFTVFIDPSTPIAIRLAYSVWMLFIAMAWFSVLCFVFAQQRVRELYHRSSRWIERIMGLVFIVFGVELIWTNAL